MRETAQLRERYLMSSLDKRLVRNPFNLEVNLQRETLHLDGRSQNNRRVNFSLSGGFLLSSIVGHELKGTQKARWKRRRYTCGLLIRGQVGTHRHIP